MQKKKKKKNSNQPDPTSISGDSTGVDLGKHLEKLSLQKYLLMQTHRSFLSLCGRVAKQLLCEPPTPSLMPRALTIVAILLQVLLKLVRRQTGVLIHPEVSQAFCRPLCVCVLHPFWIDKGLPVEPRLSTLFHLLWFSAVFTLGPPPSPRSVAPSNSGVLD